MRARVAVLVVVAPALLAGCNWEEFRFGPSRTGFNPLESSITSANVSTLALAWSAETGGAVGDPVVGDGRVFVNARPAADPNLSTISAHDAATGALEWSVFPNGPSTGFHDPSFSNGVVYAGSVQPRGPINVGGSLRALDAITGATRWDHGGLGAKGSPAVVGDIVYSAFFFEIETFPGSGWMANDRATGDVLFGGQGQGSPAIANGILYQSGRGRLAAFDATGDTCGPGGGPFPKLCQPLWTASGNTTAAVTAGTVYVGDGGAVDAYNASTGALRWTATTGGAVVSSPAVANGAVYVGSGDGKLYALDATTGAQLWTGSTGGAVNSSPAVANGVVYVGSNDTNLYGFGAAGCHRSACAPLWAVATGAPVASSPAVANGMVFVGSGDNLLAYKLPGS